MRNLIIIIILFGSAVASYSDAIYDNKWALIIGIDKYQNEKHLSYAVQDAKAIRDLLITQFGYSGYNITLLTNDDATLQNIKTHLGSIAKKTGKNDEHLGAGVAFAKDLLTGFKMVLFTDFQRFLHLCFRKPLEDGNPSDNLNPFVHVHWEPPSRLAREKVSCGSLDNRSMTLYS